MADTLLIGPKLEEIKEGIEGSLVSIITAETGSGKTIGIPLCLMNDYRIFCALPTIAATKSSAKYLRSITKINTIGTACQGDIQYDDDDTVIYCTHGHLARKLIRTISALLERKVTAWFTDMIIVDEYHLQTVDISIIVNLWKYYYEKFSMELICGNSDLSPLPDPPKIIISSATISKELISDFNIFQPYFFSGTDLGKPFCVEKIFHIENSQPNMNERYITAATLAKSYHQTEPDGVFLIFAPGKYEIEIITKALSDFPWRPEELKSSIHILHSEIEFDLRNIKPNGRTIVVATNVAECSITIPNVVLVIDTGTVKISHYDDNESFQLQLDFASKTSCHQRAGRTGRTCSGKYIYLGSQTHYESLPENIPSEITRQPIYPYLVKMIQYSIDPRSVFADHTVSINHQLDILVRREYLIGNGHFYELTEMGRFAINLPFNLRLNSCVYHLGNMLISNAVKEFCILILASIDNYGRGIIQRNSPLLARDPSATTLEHLISLWKQLMKVSLKRDALQEYCRNNLVDYRNVRETLTLYYRAITCLPSESNNSDAKPLDISKILGDVFRITYSDLTGHFVRGRRIGIMIKDEHYFFSPAALLGNLSHEYQYIALASISHKRNVIRDGTNVQPTRKDAAKQITIYHRFALPSLPVKSLYD
jgi:HrpA-like RNA helicase